MTTNTTNNSSFYNNNGNQVCANAYYAIQAAEKFKSIGRDAAIRYMMKRTNTSFTLALRLITLARQLMVDLDFAERLTLASGTQAAKLPALLLKEI